MLVPIKPVTCDCGREKFKDWVTDKGAYEVNPLEEYPHPLVDVFADRIEVQYIKHEVNPETINDAKVVTFDYEFFNDTEERVVVEFGFYSSNDEHHSYQFAILDPHRPQFIAVPKNVLYTANRYYFRTTDSESRMTIVYNNVNRNDFKLSDIIISDLITSKEDEFFNTYYANWCIVDPFDDFENELKVAFMLAEDKLKAYKEQLEDFNPSAKTVMSVAYGQRDTTSDDYEYPINTSQNIQPNRTQKGKQNAVTDTTTVDKNEEPFKNLDKTKAMDGWLKFFVDQFRDCFTLAEAMTW